MNVDKKYYNYSEPVKTLVIFFIVILFGVPLILYGIPIFILNLKFSIILQDFTYIFFLILSYILFYSIYLLYSKRRVSISVDGVIATPGLHNKAPLNSFYMPNDVINQYKFHITNVKRVYIINDQEEFNLKKKEINNNIGKVLLWKAELHKTVCFELKQPIVQSKKKFQARKLDNCDTVYVVVSEPEKLVDDVLKMMQIKAWIGGSANF